MLSEKPKPNGYILYDSVYITLWNDKIIQVEKWIVAGGVKEWMRMGEK